MLLWALGFAPRFLRDRALLRHVRFEPERTAGIVVKLAETVDELAAAARLVHDAYVARGILEPHPSRLKFHPHALVPTSLTFVAKRGEKVVGTIALIADSVVGLPMDATYAPELALLRARGERLAEVSSLAVDDSVRSSGVFYLLNRIMIRSAILLGVTRAVIAVHPRSAGLYRLAMAFESVGPRRAYAGLNRSAEAVALGLSVPGLAPRLHEQFAHLGPVAANPHHLYFEMSCPAIQQPTLSQLVDTRDRLDAYAALARTRMDLFRALPDASLAYFRRELPGVLWPSRSSMDLERYLPAAMELARA
jgi:hypothetical protein